MLENIYGKIYRVLNDSLYFSTLSIFELEYSFANAQDSITKNKIRDTIITIQCTSELFEIPIKSEMAVLYGDLKSILFELPH